MNKERGRALLLAKRSRVELLLDEMEAAGQEDRAAANAPGDLTDPAERLTAEEGRSGVRGRIRATY